MDPLAHTLVGAAFAETGLRRKTALATPTLIIGANLPDIDALVTFGGSDASLLFRRGITHGVLALVVMPWLLAGAMLLFDGARRRRNPDRPPLHFGWLLGLAYLGVLSHPLLDWLNTYGVRLLKPFSERWFYGDTLFIIDPWMWLLAGCAVVLARSRTRRSVGAWIVLGLATTALVLLSGVAPWPAMVLWCVAVIGIAFARGWGGPELPTARVARTALAVLGVYIVFMFVGSRVAEARAVELASAEGIAVEDVMAGPLPARPLRRDVVVIAPDRYHFYELSWLGGQSWTPAQPSMPRLDRSDPIVAAALASPAVRGFENWMRYPSARVEGLPDGYRVVLYDVRYSRGDDVDTGIGRVEVELDQQLRPR